MYKQQYDQKIKPLLLALSLLQMYTVLNSLRIDLLEYNYMGYFWKRDRNPKNSTKVYNAIFFHPVHPEDVKQQFYKDFVVSVSACENLYCRIFKV